MVMVWNLEVIFALKAKVAKINPKWGEKPLVIIPNAYQINVMHFPTIPKKHHM